MLEQQGISKEITFFSDHPTAYRPDHKQDPLVDVLGFRFKPKPETVRTKPNVADCVNNAKTRAFEVKNNTSRLNNLVKNNDRHPFNPLAP